MNRRAFLSTLLALPVISAASCLPRPAEVVGLSPIVETLVPIQAAEAVPVGGPVRRLPDPPLHELADTLQQIIGNWEQEYPGIQALVTDRLVLHQAHGRTLTELLEVAERRWPWRAGSTWDGWQDHAMAISEVGKV